MKSIAFLLAALTGWASAGPAPEAWFNHGTSPIQVDPPTHSDLLSHDCRSCHRANYEDWSRSRHAVAWDNEIFQEGFLVEPQARCIFCHAPMQQQFVEIQSKKAGGLMHEGVNCAVCHIREKTFFSPNQSGEAFHPYVKSRDLKSPRFCAGCHQFNFNRQVNGRMVLESMVVQDTYREWETYRKRGGTRTCQSCHMPEGRHVFRGAHDLKYLASALSVRHAPYEKGFRFEFRPVGVGHDFPTGDLFRHLTFEVMAPSERQFRVLYTFGREYTLKINHQTGDAYQALKRDTAMKPFRSTRVDVPLSPPFRYRIRYHYGSARNELMSRLASEKLVKVIHSGEVRK